MKEVDLTIEPILTNVFGRSFNKELFNGHLIHASIEEGSQIVMSLDGYIMIENDKGEAQIAIPTDMIAITRAMIEIDEREKNLSEFLNNRDIIDIIEMMEFKEEDLLKINKDQSQTWKKSNQRHPAYKR